jgi:hypothetical protein
MVPKARVLSQITGVIDPYTAAVLAEASNANARATLIEQLGAPSSVEEYLVVARGCLAELQGLASEFPAIIDDRDRQWLDKLDDANELISGAWHDSGGRDGTAGAGGGGGGQGKPPADGTTATTKQAADAEVKQRSWWEKFSATVVSFVKRVAAVAWDIGKKMAKSAVAQAKSVIPEAWGKFWDLAASAIGQMLFNAALGYIGV